MLTTALQIAERGALLKQWLACWQPYSIRALTSAAVAGRTTSSASKFAGSLDVTICTPDAGSYAMLQGSMIPPPAVVPGSSAGQNGGRKAPHIVAGSPEPPEGAPQPVGVPAGQQARTCWRSQTLCSDESCMRTPRLSGRHYKEST